MCFLKRIMEEFCLLMRGRSNVFVCHGQIKSAFMKGGNDLDTGKLLRYSMQLAMLRQLLMAKKITESEHKKIERRLKKDYGIISDITSCIVK